MSKLWFSDCSVFMPCLRTKCAVPSAQSALQCSVGLLHACLPSPIPEGRGRVFSFVSSGKKLKDTTDWKILNIFKKYFKILIDTWPITHLSMVRHGSRLDINNTLVSDETNAQNHHPAVRRYYRLRYCTHTHRVRAHLRESGLMDIPEWLVKAVKM